MNKIKNYVKEIHEKLILWIVWNLPRSIIYWASIRMLANATTGKFSNEEAPNLNAMDALKRWKNKE